MAQYNYEGFEMPIAGLGHHVVRARLICAVMDLPAKALVLNCNQYNGAFGCSVCKHPGEMVSLAYLVLCSVTSENILQVSVGKGKSRSYPHQQVIELRSHVEHLRDAQSALSSSKVYAYF